MHLRNLLLLLENVKGKDRNFTALCPAHDDKNPSLSITEKDGKILLRCHAGCDVKNIVSALGLEMKDLFTSESRASEPRSSKTPSNSHSSPSSKNITAIYDYRDENGTLIHQTVRREPKQFLQRRPDLDRPGQFIWNLKGIQPILYNLRAIKFATTNSQSILIVEGEKDADMLTALGFTATTCPMGAGKWRREYSEALTGANVVIIPDNDEMGMKHAQNVAISLSGRAKSVKILTSIYNEWPDAHQPPKADISDYIASLQRRQAISKKSMDEGEIIVCALDISPIEDILKQHINKAPDFVPEGEIRLSVVENKPPFVLASEIKPEKVDWLWYPYIPLRKLTSMRGDPGVGKTYFALYLATAISNGWGLPIGVKNGEYMLSEPTEPAKVMFFTAEDGLGDTIVERLIKMGANLDNIILATELITFDDPRFEEGVKKYKPKLVIVDPLQAFLGDKVDMNRANEIRPIFSKLMRIAEENGCAIVFLEHLNKGNGGKAIYRGLGSMDISGAVRSIMLFGCDPENPRIKGFVHVKSNLAAEGDIIGFEISEDGLTLNPNNGITHGMILGYPQKRAAHRPEGTAYALEEAMEFLERRLADGAVNSKELFEEIAEMGISQRTLKSAKKELKIKAYQKTRNNWYWELNKN